MATFSAAKDGEQMAEYIMRIERQKTAMKELTEWVAEYDTTPTR